MLILLLTLALAELRLRRPNETTTVYFLVDRSVSIPQDVDPTDELKRDQRWQRVKRFISDAVAKRGNGHEGGDSNGAHGPGANKAKAAAVALFPGGHANAVERDSENGATWEVEVRKADGSTVDVRLDSSYHTVVVEPDSEAQGGH